MLQLKATSMVSKQEYWRLVILTLSCCYQGYRLSIRTIRIRSWTRWESICRNSNVSWRCHRTNIALGAWLLIAWLCHRTNILNMVLRFWSLSIRKSWPRLGSNSQHRNIITFLICPMYLFLFAKTWGTTSFWYDSLQWWLRSNWLSTWAHVFTSNKISC